MWFILKEYLVVHMVVLDEVPSHFFSTAYKYFIGNESQIVFPLNVRRDLPDGI